MNIQLLIYRYILIISFKQLNYLIETRNDFITSGVLDFKSREHENNVVII